MKISVVVPIYNAEKTLTRCVDSLRNQTYNNIEILLIDDGSTDNSGTISDSYAKDDNRIKVLHKRNGGVAAARNTGMDIATGEYITFCDSDDTVSPEYVEKLYIAVKNANADIAICDFIKVGKDRLSLKSCRISPGVYDSDSLRSHCLPSLLVGNDKDNFFPAITNNCWGKLFRKTILERNRKYFFEDISFGEDKLVVLSCILDASKIVYLDNEYLYFYYMTENSITHKYSSTMLCEYTLLQDHISYILQQKSIDSHDQLALLYICNMLTVLSSIFTLYGTSTITEVATELHKLILQCSKKPLHSESDFRLNFKQKLLLFCLKYKLSVLLLNIGRLIYFKNKWKRRYSHG